MPQDMDMATIVCFPMCPLREICPLTLCLLHFVDIDVSQAIFCIIYVVSSFKNFKEYQKWESSW